MWLIRVTSRECPRWRRQEQPYVARRGRRRGAALADARSPLPEELLAQVKDEQMLREAVRGAAPALPAS